MAENDIAQADDALLDLFRTTFRRHAGGVVVLTSIDPTGEPIGFTATSLASLSAVPARATFNVIKKTNGYRAAFVGNRVAVNFLGAESAELGSLFAGPFEQRFVGDHWQLDGGVPVLPAAGVTLMTEIVNVYDQGENAIVVLEIVGGRVGDEQEPLLYHNRRFGTVSPIEERAFA
ncbi:flavin reductase family protein [Leucobacter soli]|uniref:p-hydroxyphenylacetate 3-hydroxylase, reductase component n=1 Tax=Leucobacter soli TaxID=2812850 RepID=A0A916JV08_9MICO|nr:flavin reductase family protein [Leucobacter soli]CAG7600235.1 p-hydroxyphenylacetate 3-hydroxylase, reductase component [Leucobacter soli]